MEQLAVDIGDIEHLVFTAGESLELAPLAELTPDTINRFFQTRFVGALTAVPVFAPRITPGGSITMTSGTAAEQYGFGVLPVSICNAMNGATKALAVELADVARAYLYCMEQEFGTGVILTVDGGTTLV